jgi:hypothetical protein
MTGSEDLGLSEAAVKDALDEMSWTDLEQHLVAISFDIDDLDGLLDHLKRHSKFIAKYPAATLERKRDAFLDALESFVLRVVGADGPPRVQEYRAMLRLIESGYRGILDLLRRAEISGLPPAVRVSAYIARATSEYSDVMKKAGQAAIPNGALDVAGAVLLKDEFGGDYSPGAAVGSLVMTLGATLGMEAHNNKWWASDGRLVVPSIVPTTEDDRYKAGAGLALGMLWRRWERAEEKHRFLGNELRELDPSERPEQVPPNITRLLSSRPDKLELLDFIANERLEERFVQDFMHLTTHTQIHDRVVGLGAAAALPPKDFVSIEEAHAAVALSGILAFDVLSDVEERGGLTLAEWIRGYSLLKAMAEQRSDATRSDPIAVGSDELDEVLVRGGITAERARKFVDQVVFARPTGTAKGSRDIYDCPLVATPDGNYVLVVPALLASHVAMLTMSNVSRLGEAFARKGKAFESAVRELFRKNNLPCFSFEHQNGDEKYEFDAIVPWGDYIFLFECKNHGLSGYHPIRAYHFALGLASDMDQARRQAEELRTNPKLSADRLGEEWVGKKVIAVVLNCLPYSIPEDDDADVLVSDFSVVRRFFDERYFCANQRHSIAGQPAILHRTAVASQWSGERPTPEDFLAVLKSPLQFKIAQAHTTVNRSSYPVAEDTLVLSHEYLRTNTTDESFAAAAGGNPRRVKRTIEKASAAFRCAALSTGREEGFFAVWPSDLRTDFAGLSLSPRLVGSLACSPKDPSDPTGRLRTTPGFAMAAAMTSGSSLSFAAPWWKRLLSAPHASKADFIDGAAIARSKKPSEVW